MKFLLTLLIVFALASELFAQTGGWSAFEQLYSDNYITVEISFKILKDGCAQTESTNASRYKYKVTRQPRSSEYYLAWKMDYIDCNGNFYYHNNSLNIGNSSKNIKGSVSDLVIYPDDEEFTCKSLETPYYEAAGSYTMAAGGGLKALPVSKDPESITGETKIYRGDPTTLTVNGGMLGVGAKWIWYTSSCGGSSIGKGSSITVTPTGSTTYYVRAESSNNTTNCAKVTVNVNQLSITPTAIAGASKICKGESVNLTVSGGRLGAGAVWVWYEASCGSKEIGRGKSVSVTPTNPTTYFVRAEGRYNKTECAKSTVNVYEKSFTASSISSSAMECVNQSITLTLAGGVLAKDAQWKWYSGNCGSGYSIGTGITIDVVPVSSTTYFVRAEGGCNNTDCANIQVYPYMASSAPTYISSYSIKGNKVQLALYGGSLGKDAEWKWYKNECGKGKVIGTGNSIVVRLRKRTNYFARAEGACNTTNCISQYVNPLNAHKFSPINEGSGKFLHLGIGLGLDLTTFSAKVTNVQTLTSTPYTTTTSFKDQSITGFGAKGEFVFHPYMKDFFSIGIMTSGAVGTTILAFTGGKNQTDYSPTKEKYLYTRFDVGTEFAAGYYKLKALLIYKSSIQTHQYSATGNDGYYNNSNSFNKELRRETVSAGIRIAPYSIERVRYRRGFCFDFLYHFSRDYEWQWQNFNWSYNALSNFQSGAGMALWIQSVLKMQVDVSFNSSTNSSTADNSKVGLQFSLLYNRNAFY